MIVELHPEAERELYDSAAWYEAKGVGLGDNLLEEMTRCLAVIAEAPVTWPKWPGAPDLTPPIRRFLASRFPYTIAYQEFTDRVSILAFAHTSRRPFYWACRTAE